MTALSDRIHIDIRGVSGWAAEPHLAVDPVTIAAHIIISIQSALTRDLDPRDPVVVSFPQIEAGSAYNVIAGVLCEPLVLKLAILYKVA